jgi:hypothetical protein
LQDEIKIKKEEQLTKDNDERRRKSEFVAGPGSTVMKTPLRTPKIRY